MSQLAQELRRANMDGHIWLEILMLPPHPMAGQTYYTCKVPSIRIFFQQLATSLFQQLATSLFQQLATSLFQQLATRAHASLGQGVDGRHACQL
jgi:hypothetical protein